MKNIKKLIFTAVLVVGLTSVAGAASASKENPSPCKIGEKFCHLPA